MTEKNISTNIMEVPPMEVPPLTARSGLTVYNHSQNPITRRHKITVLDKTVKMSDREYRQTTAAVSAGAISGALAAVTVSVTAPIVFGGLRMVGGFVKNALPLPKFGREARIQEISEDEFDLDEPEEEEED